MQQNSDDSPQTDTGRWPAPQSGFFAAPQPVATITKARPWLIAVVAFFSLLVIVAGAGNQWVTDAVERHTRADTLGNQLAQSIYSYAWRFNARHGSDVDHLWVAGLAAAATVLVLTLLLVAIVARGFGRFWQTLFATWFVVVVATELAAYVRAAVIDEAALQPTGQSKAESILFSSFSPSAQDVFAGLVAGLLVGLFAAITAVASRREVELPVDLPAPEPLTGPWRQDETYQAPPPPAGPTSWSGEQREAAAESSAPTNSTAVLPSMPPSQRPPYAAPGDSSAEWSDRSATQPPVESSERAEPPVESSERAEPPVESSERAEPPVGRSGGSSTESFGPPSSGDDATTEFPRHSASPPPEQR